MNNMSMLCGRYETGEAQRPIFNTQAVWGKSRPSLRGNKVTGAIWWHNGKLQCDSKLLTFFELRFFDLYFDL